jgi:hypothetical protein
MCTVRARTLHAVDSLAELAERQRIVSSSLLVNGALRAATFVDLFAQRAPRSRLQRARAAGSAL